jgi:hypothetical protein
MKLRMLWNPSLHQKKKKKIKKKKKKKNVMFNLEVLDKERFGKPVTRSSARRHIHVEETRPEMLVQCVVEEVVDL